jgi:hypothetical protein
LALNPERAVSTKFASVLASNRIPLAVQPTLLIGGDIETVV